jgi:hypothetical protein
MRCSQCHAGELPQQIRFLVGECAGAEQPNSVEAVFSLNALERLRDSIEGSGPTRGKQFAERTSNERR